MGNWKDAADALWNIKNYFIVHSYVGNDRTDYNTLIPVLEKHQGAFGDIPGAVTADSGYYSEKNLTYLKEGSCPIPGQKAMRTSRTRRES